ncbi:MAG: 23S rRNA (adenine(2030)-N(6))-methyltransferase RlmJ [Pseudomonadota bacterium]
MLSYLHQFHAGNFADIHKHSILTLALNSLLLKEKPFCWIDIYGGSGNYLLEHPDALKTQEAENGIFKIWEKEWPELLISYKNSINTLNISKLRNYPGSPEITRQHIRAQDQIILNELHPAEYIKLKSWFTGDFRISIHQRDALEILSGLIPPSIRRGGVLIDPSYEVKNDYEKVGQQVLQTVKKWQTGIFLIWYPLLAANHHLKLLDLLRSTSLSWIKSEFIVHRKTEKGLYGSGMFIINPPFLLDKNIKTVEPFWNMLGQDDYTNHTLELCIQK